MNIYGHIGMENDDLVASDSGQWGDEALSSTLAGPLAWNGTEGDWSRADRVCGAARLFSPAQGVKTVPAEGHTPTPRLMGRADGLLADGEDLCPRYYALQVRDPQGLVCAPSASCQAAVIALYGSHADAVMARRDWFRHQFSEVLCVRTFPEVVRVVALSRAEALAIRRGEAASRGEVLPLEWPTRARGRKRRQRWLESFVGRLWPLLILGLMLLGAWLQGRV